ncbi:serine hydrolase domain-containing protein [Aquimarina sp. MMG016]|uniref:serine hydrolase domain-containing protein n=1 Tax=Aquimarina sp. MMG016 TaxID=2822690 RepID=UPI001B39DCAD|nr:serine hydrolase domain-containing protein [Aquimarina sp. MMG016]MBQ4822744.1 beta-lactamase family protein [Aquimarina sp. MMG016]
MRYYLITFLICSISCTNTDPKYNSDKITDLIKELVDDEFTAGVSYAMQIGNAESIVGQYGFADIENKIYVNEQTKFRIASVTKPITATAIMQLVEREEISLDNTINRFFPNFPNGSSITIYHLLSHTSGIPNWWEGGMPKDEPKNFPMCKNPHVYLERMNRISDFEPGSYHNYSNSNYVLLGEIIQLVSKQSYADYISENIFIPSGMKNTEMEYSDSNTEGYAKGYTYLHEDSHKFGIPDAYAMPFSAGGLRSTATDLLKFANALQLGTLVRKETLATMISYALLSNGSRVYESLYSPSGQYPNFPNNIDKFGYGLGFQIMDNFDTKVISHGGDIAGFNAIFINVPKSNSKLIILANTENGILSQLRAIEKTITNIELHITD